MNSIKSILKNKKASIILLVCAGIILAIVLNLTHLSGFFSWISNILLPLVLGCSIAFVLNVIMALFNEKLFKNISNQRTKNILSLICSLILIIVIIVAVILIVVPQLLSSFSLLYKNVSLFLQELLARVSDLAKNNPNLTDSLNNFKNSASNLEKGIAQFFEKYLPSTVNSTVSFLVSSFKNITTTLIALLLALYILLSKKQLEKSSRSLCFAFFKTKTANRILYIAHKLSDYFKAFIYGRVVSAICLAVIYAAAALLLRLPYTLMMSTIFAVFSIIPLFGALIGWIVGLFIIGTTSLVQAIIFTVIFVIDLLVVRNLIYPRVIGKSLGLPDIWVMVAVIVGGKAFGILGMLTAVPIFALFYTLIKEAVLRRVGNSQEEIDEILIKPNWDTYNPETEEFESKVVKNIDPLDQPLVKK